MSSKAKILSDIRLIKGILESEYFGVLNRYLRKRQGENPEVLRQRIRQCNDMERLCHGKSIAKIQPQINTQMKNF
jgi:hypothetical protein